MTLLLGFDSGLPHSFPATDTLRAIGAARLSGPWSRAAFCSWDQLHSLLLLWTPLKADSLTGDVVKG